VHPLLEGPAAFGTTARGAFAQGSVTDHAIGNSSPLLSAVKTP
jgi:hypothetical protein